MVSDGVTTAVCTTADGADAGARESDLAAATGDDAAGSDSAAGTTGGTIVGAFEKAMIFASSGTISDVPAFACGTVSDFAGVPGTATIGWVVVPGVGGNWAGFVGAGAGSGLLTIPFAPGAVVAPGLVSGLVTCAG